MASRIAVLMPVYNNWEGLRLSLRSLRNQSVACDVLIVDDGSTYPIREDACRSEYASCSVYRQSRNRGIVDALNAGLERLLGEGYTYIARLDAGDYCAENRLELQAAFLDSHPDIMLVGSDTGFIAGSGTLRHVQRGPYTPDRLRRRMHLNCCFAHPAVMMRASVFQVVGRYRATDTCAEDYGLFFRITATFPAANIPAVLTFAELNPNGLSISRRRQQLRSRLKIQIRHFDSGVPESYTGILKTLVLMMLPNKFVLMLKHALLTSCANHSISRGDA